MNYLAHALLAGTEPVLIVGGISGDFVKGRLEAIEDGALRAGIRLHRRIDSFTDRHPLGLRSRRRFSAARRRFSGVIVDVAYDHFLAANWERFSDRGLDCFVADVYRTLEMHEAQLPYRLREILPRMVEQDWLGSYREPEVVGRVLERIRLRLTRGAALAGAGEEFHALYEGLREDFMAFFPEVQRFAANERRRRI